jgi:hypothetical protein
MLRGTSWYVSNTEQYFYSKVYKIDEVTHCFLGLKNILHNVPELFIKFVCDSEVDCQHLKALARNLKDNKWLSMANEEKSYSFLHLMIVICLRYIQGQALESVSSGFIDNCQQVSAIACEF